MTPNLFGQATAACKVHVHYYRKLNLDLLVRRISASPKRVAMLENFQHENHVKPTSLSEGGIGKGKNQMQRLKSLSETRWCCRIDAARCCKQHFGVVLKTAHEIKYSPDSTVSDQKATALGVVCGVVVLFLVGCSN